MSSAAEILATYFEAQSVPAVAYYLHPVDVAPEMPFLPMVVCSDMPGGNMGYGWNECPVRLDGYAADETYPYNRPSCMTLWDDSVNPLLRNLRDVPDRRVVDGDVLLTVSAYSSPRLLFNPVNKLYYFETVVRAVVSLSQGER